MNKNKIIKILTDNNVEIWRDVDGYENIYKVSNIGNIKSLNYKNTKKEKLLKQCVDKGGYLRVTLSKNGKEKLKIVHRLIAKAFIPNPNNLPEVNHKDEDKTNNKINNLEWCDRLYNVNYGTILQRKSENTKGEKNHNYGKKFSEETIRKLSESHKGNIPVNIKKVYRYDLDGKFIKEYERLKYVEEDGFNFKGVNNVCLGKSITYKGYFWSYQKLQEEEVKNKINSLKDISKNNLSKKHSKKTYQYTKDLKLVKIWNSTKEAGENGYSSNAISLCCTGKQKFHKDYIWSYIPLDDNK